MLRVGQLTTSSLGDGSGEMKNFLIGGIIGAFLVYAYFEYYGGTLQLPTWLGGAASNYRGDRTHEKAQEALR